MIEVKIGSSENINVAQKKGEVFINDVLFNGEVIKVNESLFKVHKDSKIFTVEVVNNAGKEIIMKINGQLLDVSVADHIDKILDKLGMNMAASNMVKDVKAPMPGSILDVVVNVGDTVSKGDQLLILEAMKMENVIKSPGEGTISKIHVNEKENVEKNQVLISFE